MPIIHSALLACGRCGVEARHPIMYLPDGWIYDPTWRVPGSVAVPVGPPRFLCPNCQPGMIWTPEVGS